MMIGFVNPASAEAGMVLVNLVNTMAGDALAPCITKSSSAIVLTA